MNMLMQQPLSYPVYRDIPYRPSSVPWPSIPSYPMSQPFSPFVLSQQQNVFPRKTRSPPSLSNTGYHNLKQSTRYSNRRSLHRSVDNSSRSHQYRPSKTKSISDLEQISRSNSARLSKAHSWHTMGNHHPSNLSVAYAKEIHLTPKSRRKHSSPKKRKIIPPPQRHLPSLPKRKTSFRNRRKRSIHLPECGVVRISTLDEMPVVNHRIHQPTNSINNDRISTKGSISNSSQRRMKHNEKSKGNNSISSRSIHTNNDEDDEETRRDSDTQSLSLSSSSSSNHSQSSLQRRLNGSLRNDPLITAAMEDYRQLCRSNSQTTSLNSRRQHLNGDRLCSNSTFRSLSPSSSSSNNQSQSSFTSVERSEIRQLIKTTKKKDKAPLNNPVYSSLISTSPPPSSEQSIVINSVPLVSTKKTRKSSLTEELDREFNKLRALDPDQEITYVTPSAICKRKKTLEKPSQPIPPLPTFDELLRQVQLRPVDKSIKSVCLKDQCTEENYENPLLSIPVPRSSPIPVDEIKIEESKHEYAVPIKKTEQQRSLPQISHFQPSRNFKYNQSLSNIRTPEKRTSRSLSMLNWFQQNLTNPFPTTFQPNQIINHPNEYGTTSVTENIYISDIDVYSPSSIIDKTDHDHSLQIHLDNQTILTDDCYSDYETKQTTNLSSILDDFSHLFTRKHKHENKLHKLNQRCSIM